MRINVNRLFVPGLADGESTERDSLLPPALSESLHIPPLWLPTDQDLNGGGPRTALKKNLRLNYCGICFTCKAAIPKLLGKLSEQSEVEAPFLNGFNLRCVNVRITHLSVYVPLS